MSDTEEVKAVLDEAHKNMIWRMSRNIKRIECIRVLPGSLVYTKNEEEPWNTAPKERWQTLDSIEAWREGAFFVWVKEYGNIDPETRLAAPATLCRVAIKSKFVRKGWS